VRGLGSKAARMEIVAQALIRHHLLDPRGFVRLRNQIEDGRRACRACQRRFIGVPGEVPKVRRCVCGRVNRIPAITLRDDDNPGLIEEAPPGPARFVGPYRVLGRLGDGGHGSIFRVANGEGQQFALKRLHSGASNSARERFRREAEVLSRLSHPNVVKVFELAVDEKGRPYFTMELVEGSPLEKLKGRLEPEVFVGIVAKAAEGLHHAHEHGLVHRDVKPHNIVVGRKGEPKVVDFGLAHDVTANTLTQEGDLLGTPLYMAPEQLRGEHDRVDRRADVYSLGAVLYEGLCGRLPFVASSLPELKQALDRFEIPLPSSLTHEVSPALEAVVMRALSAEPEARQETALTLSLDLRRALRRPQEPPPAPRVPGRLRWVALIVGLFGVLSLSGAAVLFVQRRALAEDRAQAASDVEEALARAKLSLESDLLGADRAGALADAREALELAQGALGGGVRERLDPDAVVELETRAADMTRECQIALALLLSAGPFAEREEARGLLRALLDDDPEQVPLWAALARVDYADARLRSARAAAHEATRREPESGDAQFVLGHTLSLLGEPGAGISALERALRSPLGYFGRADVLGVLGQLKLAEGKRQEALRIWREGQQAAPHNEHVQVLAADLALDETDETAACEALEALLAGAPEAPFAVEAAVQYLVQAADWSRAQALLDARIAVDPSPSLLLVQGTVHQVQGNWEQAGDLYRRCAEVIPEDELIYTRLALFSARLRHLRGYTDEAIDILQRHLDRGHAHSTLSLAYELMNLLLLRDGPQDVERAEALLHGIRDPDFKVEAALLEWRIALARSDLAGAERARRKLGEKLPEHPYVLMLEARYLAALGRDEQLGLLLDHAAAKVPLALRGTMLPTSSWRPPFNTAVERLQRGGQLLHHARETGQVEELRRAGRLLSDAYALVPELVCAELLRIVTEAEAGAPPDTILAALARLDRPGVLLVSAPGFPPARQQLEQLRGRQYLRSNRPADAIHAFTEALTVTEPPSTRGGRSRRVQLLLERAEANEAAGMASAALRDLDKALEIDPLSDAARVRREQIRRAAGDAKGAEEDARRLASLRQGPREEVQRALAGLGTAASLEQAKPWLQQLRELQEVMRPTLHGELLFLASRARSRALLRWDGIGAAFDDIAALCQWDPRGIEALYDLIPGHVDEPSQREAVVRALRQPPTLRHVSPSFRAGLGGFVLKEFADVEARGAATGLIQYRSGGDDSASAPLLLAGMQFAHGYRARARGVLTEVFELAEVPAYAHYLSAREQVASGDWDAAFVSLTAAWEGGFQPQAGYGGDRFLAPLRELEPFARFTR